jgi:non-canonical purine NTP pyrophosphatase (RdgB/HAM1 family)
VHSSQETLAHIWTASPTAVPRPSALAIAGPDDEESDVLVVEGRVKGSLAKEPRGANGFGWDVLFIPDGDTRTFAEMELGEKDAISHRFRAFEALRRALSAQKA